MGSILIKVTYIQDHYTISNFSYRPKKQLLWSWNKPSELISTFLFSVLNIFKVKYSIISHVTRMRDIIICWQHFLFWFICRKSISSNKGYWLKNMICIILQDFSLELESIALGKCSKQSWLKKFWNCWYRETIKWSYPSSRQ